MEHLFRSGTTGHGPFTVDVSPEDAGWRYTGLKIAKLSPGGSVTIDTGPMEYLVIPMAGGVEVKAGSECHRLNGRGTVFGEVTDYAYLPRDTSFTLTSESGGRFALPCALAETSKPVRYCPAEEVRVELRGAGNCSRQVVNYAISNALETDRLLVCEVLTPGGNWSSYPPHKHDEESEHEHELEEIYYFEIRGDEHGPGLAFHATYASAERPIEVAAKVATGDLALVPHGWHGPCVAAPGYDLYYLNVMAGPYGPEWKSVDDPCYGWVRETWRNLEIDPRLPMSVKEAVK